jgi:hypothetical protein
LVDNKTLRGEEDKFLLLFLKCFQNILELKFDSSALLYLIELPTNDE